VGRRVGRGWETGGILGEDPAFSGRMKPSRPRRKTAVMSGMRVALALLVALASMGGAGGQQLSVWGTLGLTEDREKLIKGLISTMPEWNQYSEEERWKVTGVLLKVFKNWEKLGFGESANNADADQKLLEAAFGIGAKYAVKPRTVPYIGGIWELTYTYNELKGPADNLIQNPCRGPFPYRYTWDIHVYQEVNDGPNGTFPALATHAPAIRVRPHSTRLVSLRATS
jgi:hypothetical protein